MPTYSYACTECGDRFDAVQAFSDSALTTCPKCNGRLRKLFGNVGVVFKGSGFYRTDSRESSQELDQEFDQRLRQQLGVHQLVVVGEVQLHLVQRFELQLDQLCARRGRLELTRGVIHRRGPSPRRHSGLPPSVAAWGTLSIRLS